MADTSSSASGLRPIRPILRHPFVEDILPVEGQPPAPAPPAKAVHDKAHHNKAHHKPAKWSHAQLLKDLAACDGGTGIYAKAKAANGGKDPIFKVGHSAIGSGGSTDTTTGIITLDPDQSRARAAQIAIFELTNLSNKAKFAKVDTKVAAGKLSREQYIRAEEAIEYQGIANENRAFHSCGVTWGSPKGVSGVADFFARAKNFNDYYKNYLGLDHKEFYGKFWDKNYKAIYTAVQHPHKH